MFMRTRHIKFVTMALILGITAAVALAASVHFIKSSAARQGNNLVVSFKIAGLGDNESITVTASCKATADYQCINGGGKNPSAANKEQVIADLSVSGDFTSDKNGSVNGTLTINPPPATLDCPNGQRLVLQSVKYENVSVAAGGDTANIPGTF
jgi:hypothetical protein